MRSPLARPQLERLLAERSELQTRLDERCEALVERLRKQCPDAVPPPAPKPGMLAEPVVVADDDLESLFRAALEPNGGGEGPFVLGDGDSELVLEPLRSRLVPGDGLLLAVLGVDCHQTGPAEVTVAFGIGTEDTYAGMIATTERRPRGPEVVVERWGEALVALAWEALLSVLAGLTRHAGTDLDRAPLIPAAVTAARGSISVVPQARHDADRLAT